MNKTKLYVMIRYDELVGYDASHQEVFTLYIDSQEKLVLHETLKFALNTLGYAPQECAFVTDDLIKTHFAKVIGMGVISPTTWFEILNSSIQYEDLVA